MIENKNIALGNDCSKKTVRLAKVGRKKREEKEDKVCACAGMFQHVFLFNPVKLQHDKVWLTNGIENCPVLRKTLTLILKVYTTHTWKGKQIVFFHLAARPCFPGPSPPDAQRFSPINTAAWLVPSLTRKALISIFDSAKACSRGNGLWRRWGAWREGDTVCHPSIPRWARAVTRGPSELFGTSLEEKEKNKLISPKGRATSNPMRVPRAITLQHHWLKRIEYVRGLMLFWRQGWPVTKSVTFLNVFVFLGV